MRSKDMVLMNKIKKFAEDFYIKEKCLPSTTVIAKNVGSARGTIYRYSVDMNEKQLISLPFGTHVDPICGEIKARGGTNIAAPLGTPILAAADGVVVTATWHNSYGYYVKIKHDDTYSTLYAHCSALHVSVGQTVKQG